MEETAKGSRVKLRPTFNDINIEKKNTLLFSVSSTTYHSCLGEFDLDLPRLVPWVLLGTSVSFISDQQAVMQCGACDVTCCALLRSIYEERNGIKQTVW